MNFLQYFEIEIPHVVKIIFMEGKDRVSHIANTKAADDLATQGARASTVMVMTSFEYFNLSTRRVSAYGHTDLDQHWLR